MVIAKLRVSGTEATVESSLRIPAGAEGLTLQIAYDGDIWDQLQKTAVFRSSVIKDVINVGNEVTIPVEVLAQCGEKLYVGIYGTDPDGILVVPTLWTDLGRIFSGTDPSGDESTDPQLPVWAQLQNQINQIQSAKNSIDASAYGLPVLYLEGDTAPMTKENPVQLHYFYGNLSGTASVKWQGASSLGYPKKNYTVKFDQAFEAAEGWGPQKKYCLKANYIDFSHARNIVSAKLWGQLVKSRETVPVQLAGLPNGGAIDGFPVCVFINEEYQGIYTFNIPKDGWMFGMGNGEKECIISANAHSDATRFHSTARCDESDFEVEYIPDETNTQWAIDSLNTLIRAVMDSDGTDMDTVIAQYLDLDSAIDWFIFTILTSGQDNFSKNYLLATFDGVKWYFSPYDMDSTFGLWWDGKQFISPISAQPTVELFWHKLADLLKTGKFKEIKARYQQLIGGVLSVPNVSTMFANFISKIPLALYHEDTRLWPMLPSTAANNLSQICDNYARRTAIIDAQMNALEELIIPDPSVLSTAQSWYKGSTDAAAITAIHITNSYTPTGTETESWNADANNSGTIKCYIDGTTLTMAATDGARKIMLNSYSSDLFAAFTSVETILGTELFVAAPQTTMDRACFLLTKLTTPIHIPDGVESCFAFYTNCIALTEPSKIPDTAKNCSRMYDGCTALASIPALPAALEQMAQMFRYCNNVTSTNNIVIPAGVTAMGEAFSHCPQMVGTITIHAANIETFDDVFLSTPLETYGKIYLTGSNTQLAEIAATNTAGCVEVMNT